MVDNNCLYIKVRPSTSPSYTPPYTPPYTPDYTTTGAGGAGAGAGAGAGGGGGSGTQCESGKIAGADGVCYPECGTGKYCPEGTTCYQGQCMTCPSGTTLGTDGLCHAPKSLLTTVICENVAFNGTSIPRGSKIYDDGSVDGPNGQPMTVTVDATIWNQIKQTDGTCANTVTTGGGSDNPSTPSSGGGGGDVTTGTGTASFITGEDDYKILAEPLTLADGTEIPTGSIIYRDGSVILPNGNQQPAGTVSCDTLGAASKLLYNCAATPAGETPKAGVNPLLVVAGIVTIGAIGYYLYTESQKDGKGET